MRNIIFIGMPASGKSTVGVVIAKRLGLGFVDTDLLIQAQEKKLLKEIIAEVGHEGFLKIENQVNRDLMVEDSVISPGGSVVYCEEAMNHFKEMFVRELTNEDVERLLEIKIKRISEFSVKDNIHF